MLRPSKMLTQILNETSRFEVLNFLKKIKMENNLYVNKS